MKKEIDKKSLIILGLVIGLAVVLLMVYWFILRPSSVRKSCAIKIKEVKTGSCYRPDPSSSKYDLLWEQSGSLDGGCVKSLRDSSFEQCLHENGL